jgi:outer membrane protein W
MAAPSLRAPDRADEGPWSLRFDATYLDDSGSDRSGGSAALGGEFRFNDHLALAVSLTVPRTHSFEVQPSQNAAASRAGARLQTSALGIRYFLVPGKPLQPYLGAGIGITMVSDVSAAPGLDRTAVGPWVQGGLDYPLAPHWLLNADVSWVQVHPGSSAGSTVHIDPVQLGIGVVYRFGPSGP